MKSLIDALMIQSIGYLMAQSGRSTDGIASGTGFRHLEQYL
jgi:hypothetical protein